jgi:hypothetical protein
MLKTQSPDVLEFPFQPRNLNALRTVLHFWSQFSALCRKLSPGYSFQAFYIHEVITT